VTGRDFWVTTLRPWAAAGYLRGFVDDQAVVLVNEATGHEVLLPRPASWVAASLVVPALEADDPDPELTRGVRYLMKVGSDRMELNV
jgi:hypothetical protein